MAVEEAKAMMKTDTLTGLIHHSDRGVQYCCDAYVKILRDNGISVSMTEDYNPTDNAVAESINGKIKVECVYRTRFDTFGQAREVIARYIHFYNCHRPHMSIGYKGSPGSPLRAGGTEKNVEEQSLSSKEQED